MLETLVAICIGIGLAAACGFRVFVPMLILSGAAKADLLSLSEGFQWLDSWPALAAFAVATAAEIGAYYLPWLDNLLDSVATPAAAIAGMLISAACVVDLHPLFKWSLAIIAGGGAAGTIKTGLAGLRLGSTATTGGTGNPLVSTVEWIASVAMSILSIFLPVLAAILAVVISVLLLRFALRIVSRFRRGKLGASQAES
jgi:hypothetical protein